MGDRGNAVIENQEAVERFVERLRRGQTQETAALRHEALIIGQNVARAVGRVAFAHIADQSVAQQSEKGVGGRAFGLRELIFRQQCKLEYLLLVGQLGIGKHSGDFLL